MQTVAKVCHPSTCYTNFDSVSENNLTPTHQSHILYNLYLVSCILYLVYCILDLVSCILYLVSFTLKPVHSQPAAYPILIEYGALGCSSGGQQGSLSQNYTLTTAPSSMPCWQLWESARWQSRRGGKRQGGLLWSCFRI